MLLLKGSNKVFNNRKEIKQYLGSNGYNVELKNNNIQFLNNIAINDKRKSTVINTL